MDNLEAQVAAAAMLDMDIATAAVMLAAKDMMADKMAKAGAVLAVVEQAAMLVLRIVHNMAAVVDQVQFQDLPYHAVAAAEGAVAREAAAADRDAVVAVKAVIHLSKDKQARITTAEVVVA
jgi:hypothetical protein